MISFLKLATQVVQAGRCTGCGACQGMCPYWVSHHGRTYENYECNQKEGRCERFCPRMPTDTETLRSRFFDEKDVIAELGPVKELLCVRAVHPAENAQHGGTVTALVSLALQEGFLDSAVLTRSDGIDSEGVLAVTPEDVAACAGSSFRIAPSLSVLNRALREGTYSSIGVVGTPCKTLAAYKMRASEDGYGKNIGMVFGLFCGWGLDWDSYNRLIDAYGDAASVTHADILPSSYHSLELMDREGVHGVDLDEVLPLVRENCGYCADMTAEFADLSVGGARTGDGWETDKGWNQLIVRSEKGAELVKLALERSVLEARELPENALSKLKAASLKKKERAAK